MMQPGELPRGRGERPSLLGDRAKIAIMGVLLALLVLAYVLPERAIHTAKTVVNRPPNVDVSVFLPDPEILATIEDGTDLQRGGGLEAKAWAHLMRKSYNIGGPAIAAALKLPDVAADLARLRAQPSLHRGSYIWVKGRLEEFTQQKLHPVARAQSYKGQLRTERGEPVIFWVSKPLPQAIRESSNPWVRVEGFFMKIVDEHYVNKPDVLNAPVLIGPRVVEAYPDWDAVDKLDLGVLRRVENAVYDPDKETWANDRDMRTLLADSQDVPLWHMASFARKEAARLRDANLRHTEIFELKDQYTAFKHGIYEQGAPIRLRGTFILANVLQAETNPVGIKYWSEVWMRIPRMGAKLIPIWVPEDIGEWQFGESMDVDAFFFKNYGYRVPDHPMVHTPLFVAGKVARFKISSHPVTIWVGALFAAFVAFVAFLFFRMNRHARRDSDEYKTKLVERRRKRRATMPGLLQPD